MAVYLRISANNLNKKSHLQFFQNAAAAPPRNNKVGATSLAPQIIQKRKGAWFYHAPFNVAPCKFLLSAALPMFFISTEPLPIIPVCHFDRRREAPKWRNLSIRRDFSARSRCSLGRNGNKWRKKEHGFFPCSFDYCALFGAEGIKVLRARKF